MFEASVDGQPYDPDRWANYYKPSGFQGGSGTDGETPSTAPAPVAQARPAPAPVAQETPPWEAEEPEAAAAPVQTPAAKPGASQRAEDILAMIRNRKQS